MKSRLFSTVAPLLAICASALSPAAQPAPPALSCTDTLPFMTGAAELPAFLQPAASAQPVPFDPAAASAMSASVAAPASAATLPAFLMANDDSFNPGLPPFYAVASDPPLGIPSATPPAFLMAQHHSFNPGLPPFYAVASDPPLGIPTVTPPAFLMAQDDSFNLGLLPFYAVASDPPLGIPSATPPAFLLAQDDSFNPGLPPFYAVASDPPVGIPTVTPPTFLMAQDDSFNPGLPPFYAVASDPPLGIPSATPPAFLMAQNDSFNPGLPPFYAVASDPPLGIPTVTPPAFLMAQDDSFNPGLPPFTSAVLAEAPVGGTRAVPPPFLSPALPAMMAGVGASCESGTTLARFYFGTASARLSAETQVMVQQLAEKLKQCPAAAVQVNGHADNVGTEESNMVLAQRRARAIIRALEQHGIDGRRLEWASRGQSQPIASNETPEGRALNRRIEITIR